MKEKEKGMSKEVIIIIDEMLNEHSRYEKGIPMTADWLKCRADSINAIVALTTPADKRIEELEKEVESCKRKYAELKWIKDDLVEKLREEYKNRPYITG